MTWDYFLYITYYFLYFAILVIFFHLKNNQNIKKFCVIQIKDQSTISTQKHDLKSKISNFSATNFENFWRLTNNLLNNKNFKNTSN